MKPHPGTSIVKYAKATHSLCDGKDYLKCKPEKETYCNRGSPSPCNILSCLFAYIVKEIVAATDAANPRTLKMICGAERKWSSCEASAKVRIKIPLQQDANELSEIQRQCL